MSAKSIFSSDAALLSKTHWGTLSMIDAQGKPYGIALNAVYHPEKNCLYFHCAKHGHKVEALDAHPDVSYFALVEETLDAPHFTTHYTSIVARGTARLIEDESQAIEALAYLTETLAPGMLARKPGVADSCWKQCVLYRIDLEEVSCKQH